MGPEATLFKRVGFAASMNKPEASVTGMQPRIGFAAAMHKYEDDLAVLEIAPKIKAGPPSGPSAAQPPLAGRQGKSSY